MAILDDPIFMWHEVEYLFIKRITDFNFNEHIHMTPSNPLFLATIVVNECSIFYFPIISLSVFMWHEVELLFKRATNFNFDEHIHVTPRNLFIFFR